MRTQQANPAAAASAPVCILGMHRSGTSSLAGSLQEAGMNLGKHHTWNRFNQRGNRENQDIVDFHDSLLESNGGSWSKPPRKLRWTSAQEQQARDIAGSFSAGSPWGFKDPRTLLVLELWRKVSPDLRLVGIFRHPLAVAKSLQRRSGGRQSIEQGMQLWLNYNQRLLQERQKSAFPLLCFDQEPEAFRASLRNACESLGLPRADAAHNFYDPSLKHFDSADFGGVPKAQLKLYRQLEDLCA